LPTGDGDNLAILEDDTGAVAGVSQIRSGNGTFETTAFANPATSLTINTGNDGRDNDLRSPNYFDAAQFPNMTFKSKSITKNGDNKLKLVGDLTIKGVTKEVTLDVDGPSAPMKMGPNQRRGLSATTSVNRKDFGVGAKAPAAMISEEIKIDLDVELTQKAAGQ